MRRILALLAALALAATCGAQTFPTTLFKVLPQSAPRSGLVLEFLSENYATGTVGADAIWSNTGSLGSVGNATQSTLGSKPSYANGYLTFSSDLLVVSNPAVFSSLGNDFTIVVKFSAPSVSPTAELVFMSQVGSPLVSGAIGPEIGRHSSITDGGVGYQDSTGGPPAVELYSSPSLFSSSRSHVVAWCRSYSDSTLRVVVDGSIRPTVSYTLNDLVGNINYMGIAGGWLAGAFYGFNHRIAWVRVYNRILNLSELAHIEDW